MLLNTILLNSATARQFQDTIFKILGVRQYCIKILYLLFWVNLCTISDSLSATMSQITKRLLNIGSLTNFTMQISTTAQQTSNCMQIITYRVARFRTNHFQNTPCPAVSYFLDFELIQIEKTEISCAIFQIIVLLYCFALVQLLYYL